MKNAPILLILFSALISCKKPQADLISNRITKSVVVAESTNAIGDPNKTPDLAPVLYERAYEGYYFGILAQGPYLALNYQIYGTPEPENYIEFYCPVENLGMPSNNTWSPLVWTGTDYSGADFVWNAPITDSNFLVTTIFKNGLPISTDYKGPTVGWQGEDGDHISSYNPVLDNRTYLTYPITGGVLHPMFSDTYLQYRQLDSTPSGKYALVVTYNAESYTTHQRLFREYRYDNNTAVAGFMVDGSSIHWDSTAIAENIPKPVSNLVAKYSKGKIKTITLNWISPYDGTGVIHKYRIKRDGVVIADDQWNNTYLDMMPPNAKTITYTVETKIEGLGISPANSILVKK
jgi:hypothetical protein